MDRPLHTTEMYWCKTCHGWWLPDNDLLVHCTDLRKDPAPMVPVSIKAQQHEIHIRNLKPSVDDCPHCNPQGENPLTVYEGYNEETEA